MSCNSINGEFPDIWDWISTLPAASDWKRNDKSFKLCSGSQASLLFSAIKKHGSQAREEQIIFSLLADFQFSIPLWTSEPCRLQPREKAMFDLFLNFIGGILLYSPHKWAPRLESHIDQAMVIRSKHSKGMFKCVFLALALCVCFYEAPGDIRSCCVEVVERELEKEVKNGDYWKAVLEVVGSKIEEQVMRSMALLITNRIFRASKESKNSEWDRSQIMRIPLPCSYSTSTKGLWQVRVYSPILGMKPLDKHHSSKDDRLAVALSYLHVEAVLQLSYDLNFTPDWIEVRVKVDNIRCDVVPLVSEEEMEEESGLPEEKHFPSTVSIELAPEKESKLLAVSLNMSSGNPSYEMSSERSAETGFEPPGIYGGVRFTGTEGLTVSMKAWKMEQSVDGSQGIFDWALYDTLTTKKVSSSRPSKMEWMQPKAWFKDRYSSAFSPFTRQGGVVFAGDAYSEGISWKVKTEMEGKIMRWEVGGSICVTYWPNKYRTFFCETRQLDFCEPVDLPLIRSGK
ncbi:hypothetical protein SUGI_0753350 [Cryptomeria japonica]|uniref:uncharacterized protein LOC131048549 n=1 Tax=Cryptomeria japonica TaxID=3369 RepID=UPI0024147BBF|nr:uncharacterized protein LOC131048549 [Cryptomeria japonica]GLJ37148.1 hypothetical protein SUGI_0753350 [Cryptomeria japonica]